MRHGGASRVCFRYIPLSMSMMVSKFWEAENENWYRSGCDQLEAKEKTASRRGGWDREGQAARVAFGQQVCSQVKSSGGIIGTADTPQLVLALLHWKKCSWCNCTRADSEQKPTQLQCTECQSQSPGVPSGPRQSGPNANVARNLVFNPTRPSVWIWSSSNLFLERYGGDQIWIQMSWKGDHITRLWGLSPKKQEQQGGALWPAPPFLWLQLQIKCN